jgi:hypothetical protein
MEGPGEDGETGGLGDFETRRRGDSEAEAAPRRPSRPRRLESAMEPRAEAEPERKRRRSRKCRPVRERGSREWIMTEGDIYRRW